MSDSSLLRCNCHRNVFVSLCTWNDIVTFHDWNMHLSRSVFWRNTARNPFFQLRIQCFLTEKQNEQDEFGRHLKIKRNPKINKCDLKNKQPGHTLEQCNIHRLLPCFRRVSQAMYQLIPDVKRSVWPKSNAVRGTAWHVILLGLGVNFFRFHSCEHRIRWLW